LFLAWHEFISVKLCNRQLSAVAARNCHQQAPWGTISMPAALAASKKQRNTLL
jgi:hypothetical protein